MHNQLVLAFRINRETQYRNIRLDDVDFERNPADIVAQLFKDRAELRDIADHHDLSVLEFLYAGRILDKKKSLQTNGIANGSSVYVFSRKLFSVLPSKRTDGVAGTTANDNDDGRDNDDTIARIGSTTDYRIKTVPGHLVDEKFQSLRHHFNCPKFRTQFIEVLTLSKITEQVIKHYRNVKNDPIAIGMLSDPEILANTFETQKFFNVHEQRPLFGPPAISILQAVLFAIENEQNDEYSSSKSPFSYSLLAVSDDDMSEDEQTESLSGELENQDDENETATPSSNPITNEMLEAALRVGGLFSQDDLFTSTDESARTSQNEPVISQFVNEMDVDQLDVSLPLRRIDHENSAISEYSENTTQTMSTTAATAASSEIRSASSTPPVPSVPSVSPEAYSHDSNSNSNSTTNDSPSIYENELEQLRDLGFTDTNRNRIILEIFHGDVQATVDILLHDD